MTHASDDQTCPRCCASWGPEHAQDLAVAPKCQLASAIRTTFTHKTCGCWRSRSLALFVRLGRKSRTKRPVHLHSLTTRCIIQSKHCCSHLPHVCYCASDELGQCSRARSVMPHALVAETNYFARCLTSWTSILFLWRYFYAFPFDMRS